MNISIGADDAVGMHTATLDTAKVYRFKQGRYAGKWKDPWTGAWQTKTLPRDLWEQGDDEAAQDWFRRWLIETLARGGVRADNEDVIDQVPTISALVDRWQRHRVSLGDDPKDVAATVSCIRRRGEKINDVPLQLLTVPKVAQWIRDMRTSSGLANMTIINVVKAFRALTVDARGYGWIDIPSNPFTDPFLRKVLPPAVKMMGKDVIMALKPEQMTTLARCRDIPEHRWILNLVALATGLRKRELFGLAWEHVDLETGMLRVVRQLKDQRAQTFKPPKKGSKGAVPLHPSALDALKAWKAEGWQRRTSRKPTESDPVFPLVDGRFGHTTSARCFKEDLVTAGLPAVITTDEGKRVSFVFHNTRTSFVSALNSAGVQEDDRQILMRHTRKGVTNKSYTLQDLDRLRAAVLKLPL